MWGGLVLRSWLETEAPCRASVRFVAGWMFRRDCIDLVRRKENINIHSPRYEKSKEGSSVSWAVAEEGVTRGELYGECWCEDEKAPEAFEKKKGK